ncbi:hypothetical protein SUGI_0285610 [Cryptomeria japonica]|uniref:berberine bridge enzyme-like D-2 n=1 Tax=Cryptomeria japonica TaxID=3369 RepID=UPI002408E1DB|nr:berberine bridge enzyme-like D-2 [Cryptomeria japonica]GLJ16640.1 hypothetical protein SUGI_0285610 [Cryptomeria japonica]
MKFLICIVFLLFKSSAIVYASRNDLFSCLSSSGIANVTTQSNALQFDSLFRYSLLNLRFTEPSVRRPQLIIIPQSRNQVQKAVGCSIQYGWEIRVRSGGHSYEGLSSTADAPNFLIVDLMAVDNVHVDVTSSTAWVEAGATLGQVYAAIAEKTERLGFPAGTCPTVGSSGHFAGGGLGILTRKYGMAADNVIDVFLLTAAGKVLNRKSMGEDLFWAVRGGGGGSWGVVLAWKIRLVSVPSTVTVFTVLKTGRDSVTETVHRWQYVAPNMEKDLFMRVRVFGVEQGGNKTIQASFHGMYLGPQDELLSKVKESFPELGIAAADCQEMSWIESVAYFAGTNLSDLSTRYYSGKLFFKNKSDFARKPLPKSALRGLWPMLENEVGGNIIMSPLGGFMNETPSTALPFPHRAGNLFDIQYVLTWYEEGNDARHVEWMRNLYKYMSPYVSHSPRAAYVNYLDLDLGFSSSGSSSVEEARSWGEKYFLGNFDRLVKVKSQVDPHNVFRNAQSIPVMK